MRYMRRQTSEAFQEALAAARARAKGMKDKELALALAWARACTDPEIRDVKLLKNEDDRDFSRGLVAAWVKYGGFTFKQREVARRMVADFILWALLEEGRATRKATAG